MGSIGCFRGRAPVATEAWAYNPADCSGTTPDVGKPRGGSGRTWAAVGGSARPETRGRAQGLWPGATESGLVAGVEGERRNRRRLAVTRRQLPENRRSDRGSNSHGDSTEGGSGRRYGAASPPPTDLLATHHSMAANSRQHLVQRSELMEGRGHAGRCKDDTVAPRGVLPCGEGRFVMWMFPSVNAGCLSAGPARSD